jgi:hypothetical protein
MKPSLKRLHAARLLPRRIQFVTQLRIDPARRPGATLD